MSIVRIMINESAPPTEFEIKKFKERALKELSAINDSEDRIVCDEDCPELTEEQLSRLMPVHSRQNEYRLTAH